MKEKLDLTFAACSAATKTLTAHGLPVYLRSLVLQQDGLWL